MFYKQNVLLLITDKIASEDLIKEALSHTQKLGGQLYCRVLVPRFPKELKHHQTSYLEYLTNSVEMKIKSVINKEANTKLDVPFDIDILNAKNASAEAINFASQHNVSFLIKAPETHDLGKGFCALDMSLLRESPTPVWLFQNTNAVSQTPKLAVAIDPSDSDTTARKLSLKLLEDSAALAKFTKTDLQVISCWENFLDSAMLSSSWLNLSTSNIQEEIDKSKQQHKLQLEALVEEAQLPSDLAVNIHIRHGLAVQQIPLFVQEENIETLVMGTLARSGIAGLIMGNTAETIVQNLNCSLIALKPDEFVSPHN